MEEVPTVPGRRPGPPSSASRSTRRSSPSRRTPASPPPPTSRPFAPPSPPPPPPPNPLRRLAPCRHLCGICSAATLQRRRSAVAVHGFGGGGLFLSLGSEGYSVPPKGMVQATRQGPGPRSKGSQAPNTPRKRAHKEGDVTCPTFTLSRLLVSPRSIFPPSW